jgi:SAM-dependent methyltransferase
MSLISGKGYKTRLFNWQDELWDRKLGVQTFGFHPGSGEPGKPNWFLHYAPTPYDRIQTLYEMIGLNNDDVVVDLGAGLGRSVFLARHLGVRKATGVDIVPELIDKANISLKHSGMDRVDFICSNATEYVFDNVTVLFMAHSFGDDILRIVTKNLERSRKNLRVIYINPICDYVFEEAGWLECFGRIEQRKQGLVPKTNAFGASIWRTRR